MREQHLTRMTLRNIPAQSLWFFCSFFTLQSAKNHTTTSPNSGAHFQEQMPETPRQ
jgi:hypothetical protein